jgi:peptidoglycan/xylan/chitin deacetylase (PgdA/CDA1 family)/glycosyltransferase involved in cell wall biosynthesis
MNILHALSQFEVTGAEVYAATLATAQQSCGHSVWIVSDTFSMPVDVPIIFQPIGKRSYLQRLRNIQFIFRFIRTHHIDVVHAHSRAASWICWIATHLTKAGFVSTVHGRQHLHRSSTAFSIYGKQVIVVSESLRTHLIEEMGLNPNHVVHIPNGFDCSRWMLATSKRTKEELFGVPNQTPLILFIGRLSGPKGDVLRFLIRNVLPQLTKRLSFSFQIVTGTCMSEDISSLIDQTPYVQLLGFQPDLVPYILTASVVIGAGRVAMESLLTGKPTLAFGESGYEGLVTEENIRSMCITNFGDTGTPEVPNCDSIIDDLISVIQQPPRLEAAQKLQAFIKQKYDISIVERRVDRVYEHAMAIALSHESIPVLMYHSVIANPPNNSRHGIWITVKMFESHMRSLKHRGFTPITFKQYRTNMQNKQQLPHRPVILTFDDGYEDNYTNAFPVLQKYGFNAVIFLVTHSEKRTNFWDSDEAQSALLCAEQIKEMAHAGIEFGSHTINHPRLPECSPEQIHDELKNSKCAIEELLGEETISFAYPYGMCDDITKILVEESGFFFGVACDSGPRVFSDDFYEIRRSQIFPWTNHFGLWKKTQSWYLRYKQAKR